MKKPNPAFERDAPKTARPSIRTLDDRHLNAYYSIGRKEGLMVMTNRQSGTNVHEVADAIYRINTPVLIEGAGRFSFNQY